MKKTTSSDKTDNRKKRELAAVLFADIVGYTALMHSDEKKALTHLKKFKSELEKKVAYHHGEIIAFYGDGCLVIFKSAVEAVSCSKELQIVFKKAPEIPVRIGLHMGDIVREEGNVFGDSVNISSRIESMGAPGTVLFSNAIKNQIKNKSDFNWTSLGSYNFKNVEDPMEVFALSDEGFPIPKKKIVEKEEKGLSVFLKIGLVIFAVALTLGLGFGYFSEFETPGESLPPEILESRIAVMPFENKTNEEDLNVLGDMAADWIILGMMELENVKVVSYETIKDYVRFASLTDKMEDPVLFEDKTGAQKTILGSFYKSGDQLIFQTKILDVNTKEIEFSFPEISGIASDKRSLVNELRQKILAYFLIKEDEHFDNLARRPPKYKAFEAFQEALEVYGNFDKKAEVINLLDQAIFQDSSFFFPHLWKWATFANHSNYEEATKVLEFVETEFKDLSSYEKLYLDWMGSIMEGDIKKTYYVIKQLYGKDPKNFINNFEMGNSACEMNKPREAVEAFQQLEPANISIKFPAVTWWHAQYAVNLIRLNEFDKALEVLEHVPFDQKIDWHYDLELAIYARNQRNQAVNDFFENLKSKQVSADVLADHYLNVARHYDWAENEVESKKWHQKALGQISELPDTYLYKKELLKSAYYYGRQWKDAVSLFGNIPIEKMSLWDKARSAIIYHHLGENEKSNRFLKEVENLDTIEMLGAGKYALAMIYSMKGQKEEATNLLKSAFNDGFAFSWGRYNDAFEFSSLRDFPDFLEFIGSER